MTASYYSIADFLIENFDSPRKAVDFLCESADDQNYYHLDFYKLLGLSPNFTDDELKSAYRKAAFASHPDQNPNDPSAEERFKHISRAFEIMSDTDRRSAYDSATGRGLSPKPSNATYVKPSDISAATRMQDLINRVRRK
jgi:DnaJ-class molecular chaperone